MTAGPTAGSPRGRLAARVVTHNDRPATHTDARVRIVDGNTEAAQNARFFAWFEL